MCSSILTCIGSNPEVWVRQNNTESTHLFLFFEWKENSDSKGHILYHWNQIGHWELNLKEHAWKKIGAHKSDCARVTHTRKGPKNEARGLF